MRTWLYSILAVILLAGCAPATLPPASTPTPAVLTPYHTRTARPSAGTPSPYPTFTPLPSPTPTPRLHTIVRGDTLLSIAFLYGIDLDALRQANPDVDPNLLKVGETLVIPASPDETQPTSSVLPVATPVPLLLLDPYCAMDALGGAWCFVLARNNQETNLESVAATFHLVDAESGDVKTLTAYGLLDLVPSGSELPLAVYFPQPLPQEFQVGIELAQALPVTSSDPRYLPVNVEDVKVAILAGGAAADVNGSLRLDIDEGQARRVWVLAAAFNDNGRVVGLRRWEMESGGTLEAGQTLEFSIQLYAAAGTISRAAVWAEARP